MANKIKVDIDKAIEIYNSKNDVKITSRTQLIDMLENNVSLMTLDNLRKGKNIPKSFHLVYEIAALCKCDLNEFVKTKKCQI